MLSGRLSEKSQHPFQSNVSASSNGRCSRVRPLTTEDTGLLVRYRLEWDGPAPAAAADPQETRLSNWFARASHRASPQ